MKSRSACATQVALIATVGEDEEPGVGEAVPAGDGGPEQGSRQVGGIPGRWASVGPQWWNSTTSNATRPLALVASGPVPGLAPSFDVGREVPNLDLFLFFGRCPLTLFRRLLELSGRLPRGRALREAVLDGSRPPPSSLPCSRCRRMRPLPSLLQEAAGQRSADMVPRLAQGPWGGRQQRAALALSAAPTAAPARSPVGLRAFPACMLR